jgi:hypothetical protein
MIYVQTYYALARGVRGLRAFLISREQNAVRYLTPISERENDDNRIKRIKYVRTKYCSIVVVLRSLHRPAKRLVD